MLNELMTECRELALTIAPELRERPLYVLPHSRISWLPFDNCRGVAITGAVDQPMRDAIGEDWQGVGPVVVLDDERHGETSRDVLACCAHEIGHIVPASQPHDLTNLNLPEPAQFYEWQQNKLAALMVTPDPEPGSVDDAHDWRFIRRTIHVWLRAQVAGYRIPIEQLWTAWYPRAEHWLPLLVGEAVRMQHVRFAEIEQEPAPLDFLEKWRACLDYHQSCLTKRETHERRFRQ